MPWGSYRGGYTQDINLSVKNAFDLLAKEDGFAFVYLSNESPTLVDIFFDDVTMTYTQTTRENT